MATAISYPDSYTVPVPTIEMEEYERTKEQINEILHEVQKGESSFCKGLGDYLSEADLQSENMYGFLYKLGDDRVLVGFTLFYVDYVPEGDGIIIDRIPFKNPSKMIKGVIRCSAVKGIGRSIQGDIEDFARHNEIPLIQIEASSPGQQTSYYIEKLGYQESDANSNTYSHSYIYKVVKGGGGKQKKTIVSKRKTRKNKKRKNKCKKSIKVS